MLIYLVIYIYIPVTAITCPAILLLLAQCWMGARERAREEIWKYGYEYSYFLIKHITTSCVKIRLVIVTVYYSLQKVSRPKRPWSIYKEHSLNRTHRNGGLFTRYPVNAFKKIATSIEAVRDLECWTGVTKKTKRSWT